MTLARHPVSARTQVAISGVIGLVVGAAVASRGDVEVGVLVGWDAAAVALVSWVWAVVWPLDEAATARLAAVEDPTRAGADLLQLSASIASLGAVGFLLGRASGSEWEVLRVSLALTSVMLSWALVHTVFTLRYARLYYAAPCGGIDFNDATPPAYSDFAYLAFTVGMTFQVADTDLQSREMRRTVLQHGLLSFLFGTGILATTINLVASLSSQ